MPKLANYGDHRAAPCGHFQKLDVGINNFFSNLCLGTLSLFSFFCPCSLLYHFAVPAPCPAAWLLPAHNRVSLDNERLAVGSWSVEGQVGLYGQGRVGI